MVWNQNTAMSRLGANLDAASRHVLPLVLTRSVGELVSRQAPGAGAGDPSLFPAAAGSTTAAASRADRGCVRTRPCSRRFSPRRSTPASPAPTPETSSGLVSRLPCRPCSSPSDGILPGDQVRGREALVERLPTPVPGLHFPGWFCSDVQGVCLVVQTETFVSLIATVLLDPASWPVNNRRARSTSRLALRRAAETSAFWCGIVEFQGRGKTWARPEGVVVRRDDLKTPGTEKTPWRTRFWNE